ncbi:hypothetical protein D3C72_1594090 [compost metagenome]
MPLPTGPIDLVDHPNHIDHRIACDSPLLCNEHAVNAVNLLGVDPGRGNQVLVIEPAHATAAGNPIPLGRGTVRQQRGFEDLTEH